jgi:hypothetical protein
MVLGQGNLNGTIVGFKTTDGLSMKGYLALSSKSYSTVIHVHGACGNFYENEFLPVMAESYTENGINFLTVNTRGHDCTAEAYKDRKLVHIGGAYEILEESEYDIEGAVRFARKFGRKIVLQGHSSGCLKILYYLARSRNDFDSILLSPTDPYVLHQNYVYPEKIEHQLARIRREYADRLDDLLPPEEHGCCQKGVEYPTPISARALIAFLEGPGLKILRYDDPADYFMKSRAFIYYGAADPLWTADRKKVEQFFLEHIRNVHFFLLENGDHHFHGFEKCVTDEIVKWILGKASS